MSDKDTAMHKLKTMEKILSDHADDFTVHECLVIGTALRYLLAYIDNETEGDTIYSG